MSYADPPTVDADFLFAKIIELAKLDEYFILDNVHTFVEKGNKPLRRKLIIIQEIRDRQITYEQAIGAALRFGFLGDLIIWLEENRNWKEGGYIVASTEFP